MSGIHSSAAPCPLCPPCVHPVPTPSAVFWSRKGTIRACLETVWKSCILASTSVLFRLTVELPRPFIRAASPAEKTVKKKKSCLGRKGSRLSWWAPSQLNLPKYGYVGVESHPQLRLGFLKVGGAEFRRRGRLGCLRSSGSSCLKCVGEGSWLDTWLGELERATLGVGAAVPLRMQAEAGRWHFHCGCLQAPPTLGENLDAGGGDRLGKEGCGS